MELGQEGCNLQGRTHRDVTSGCKLSSPMLAFPSGQHIALKPCGQTPPAPMLGGEQGGSAGISSQLKDRGQLVPVLKEASMQLMWWESFCFFTGFFK